jgi:hypothetical protein
MFGSEPEGLSGLILRFLASSGVNGVLFAICFFEDFESDVVSWLFSVTSQ